MRRLDKGFTEPGAIAQQLERVTRFELATPCLGSTEGSSTLGLEAKHWFRLLASVPLSCLIAN